MMGCSELVSTLILGALISIPKDIEFGLDINREWINLEMLFND